MDSSHALGMTKKSVRNDIFGLVMLSAVKHPCAGFLTCARNDKKERAERHRPCHAERSEASILDSSHALGMTKKSVRNDHTAVMLSEAKHPPICHAERSEASTLA